MKAWDSADEQFHPSGPGPLEAQASIDLHEMMSVDAYPHNPDPRQFKSPVIEGGAKDMKAVLYRGRGRFGRFSPLGAAGGEGGPPVLGTIWSTTSRSRPFASLGNTSTPR